MADEEEGKSTMSEGTIIITPSLRKRPKYNIEKLVARIPDDYLPEELNWGPPVGREEW
jgi:antitoxin MazE